MPDSEALSFPTFRRTALREQVAIEIFLSDRDEVFCIEQSLPDGTRQTLTVLPENMERLAIAITSLHTSWSRNA